VAEVWLSFCSAAWHWGTFCAASIAGLYQIIAILAAIRQKVQPNRSPQRYPSVAILKPIRGADAQMSQAIETHFAIDYPNFELRFGFSNPQDGSLAMVQQLAARHPHVVCKLIESSTEALNRKVGVLIDVADTDAEIVVINDADISVPPEYLQHLVAELEDDRVGLVTCLYRATFHNFATRMEALSIATEFATGAMVAPLLGIKEFALGSTIALRRRYLQRIGGFAAIKDYLADDYQLGKLMAGTGKRNILSKLMVTTALDGGAREVWLHQLRWMKTIRLSRLDGYVGIPVMQAGVWSALAWLAGWWKLAAAVLVLRLVMAAFAGGIVLRAAHILQGDWFWTPIRDWLGFVLWIRGFGGNIVVWRDRKLTLAADGKILRAE
jgi:ceramide glucosyltransferase